MAWRRCSAKYSTDSVTSVANRSCFSDLRVIRSIGYGRSAAGGPKILVILAKRPPEKPAVQAQQQVIIASNTRPPGDSGYEGSSTGFAGAICAIAGRDRASCAAGAVFAALYSGRTSRGPG